MKCPFCSHLHDRVVDSRESKEGDAIRRRRECLACERRFTTYERIDEVPYMVIKKDGRREKFDRQKGLGGLVKACEKQIGRAHVAGTVSAALHHVRAHRRSSLHGDQERRPAGEVRPAEGAGWTAEGLRKTAGGHGEAVGSGQPGRVQGERLA